MLQLDFNPFPNLQTARLNLRRVKDSDADMIFALRSDPAVMEFIARPIMTELSAAHEHIKMINEKTDNNEGINWIITERNNDDMIGLIGHFIIYPENYRAETGYMLAPAFAGKGYISEALAEIVRYGFDVMRLHSIEAVIDPNNSASARVLQKAGFIREAHFSENRYFGGRFIDTEVYSLLKGRQIQF